MSWDNHHAFGSLWDNGGSLIPDLITHPIKEMISRDAARSGIDIDDPFRRTAAFASSAFLGTVCGSLLGPMGSAIGGLMGHIIGLAAEREGESDRSERVTQLNEFAAMRLKAFDLATDILKEHVSANMWRYIKGRLSSNINSCVNSWSGQRETINNCYRFLDGMENTFLNTIHSVDYNIYQNFYRVYQTAKRELNIR